MEANATADDAVDASAHATADDAVDDASAHRPVAYAYASASGAARLRACGTLRRGLAERARRPVRHVVAEDTGSAEFSYASSKKLSAVAFEMIGDDLERTREQLDSVRARRPKFICINDSMMRPSEALLRTLRDFFEDLFPRSSAFELPPGTRNPSLRLDEMRAILARRRWARFAGACAAALAAAGLAARALERVW
jgi:hypothetical protein